MTELLAAAFANGHLIDAILVVVVIEAVLLLGLWRATGRGVAPGDLAPMLAAGAMLMLALRLTLTGYGWMPVCACLALAGAAHVADLSRRWRA